METEHSYQDEKKSRGSANGLKNLSESAETAKKHQAAQFLSREAALRRKKVFGADVSRAATASQASSFYGLSLKLRRSTKCGR